MTAGSGRTMLRSAGDAFSLCIAKKTLLALAGAGGIEAVSAALYAQVLYLLQHRDPNLTERMSPMFLSARDALDSPRASRD